MIRRTKFDTHWEGLNAARATAGLPPAPAGDAKRSYAATLRAASPSGYLDWLTACDQYLEALGQPRSERDEALWFWRDGWDAQSAAHQLTRQRAGAVA